MFRGAFLGGIRFTNCVRSFSLSSPRRCLLAGGTNASTRTNKSPYMLLAAAGAVLTSYTIHQKAATCSSSSSISTSTSSSKSSAVAPTKEVIQLRPHCDGDAGFERIDETLLRRKDLAKIVGPKNMVHDTLNGKGKIETYEIYKKKDSNEVWAIITFGDVLNGYPSYVHGGMIATMIDTTFGWLFFACEFPAAMTANLRVDYRKSVAANSTVLLKTKLQESKGRKLHMVATMEDVNGNILAESTCLFIVLRKRYRYLMQIRNYLGL